MVSRDYLARTECREESGINVENDFEVTIIAVGKIKSSLWPPGSRGIEQWF